MSRTPEIEVVIDGPDWLVVGTSVEGLSVPETLAWFSDATKLNQWWGDEALIEPRPGGMYQVSWTAMDWTMRGTVALCTDDTLIYSWTWDHEPAFPARTVIVHGEPEPNGTRLTITHGPYRPRSVELVGEIEDRENHLEGWLFFLPELHATIAKTRST